MITNELSQRDRSRRPNAKARAVNRRKARVAKSALLFLAFAFPADLAFEGAR